MKKANKRTVSYIILGLVLMLSMSGCSAINALTKKYSPEKYVAAAWEKTNKLKNRETPKMPDIYRFINAPNEQTVTLGVKETNLPGTEALSNASISINAKTDNAAEKMLMDFSVSASGVSIGGNQFFLSKDLIALSVPLVYSDQKYVTLNPKTFNQDWNASVFAQFIQIPDSFNMEKYIDTIFEASRVNNTRLIENYKADIKNMTDKLKAQATLSNGGTEELLINGNTVKTDKFVYTVSASAVNTYYKSLLDIYAQIMDESMVQMAQAGLADNAGKAYAEQLKTMKSDLEKVTFTNDLQINVYINNNQLVNKIEVSDLAVGITVDGKEKEGRFSYAITYAGQNNLYDQSFITISEVSRDDNKPLIIEIERNCASSKTAIDETFDINVNIPEGRTAGMTLKFNWDSALKGEDNFEMNFTVPSDNAVFSVKGELQDTPEEISFKNGIIKGTSGNQFANLTFDYAIKAAKAEDSVIDASSSRSLFDFDMLDIYGILGSLSGMQ